MSETLKRFIGSAITTVAPQQRDLVVVPPAPPTLAERAATIRNQHGRAMAALGESLTAAIDAGKELIAAKASVKHGLWQDYVGIECGISLSTANNYMRLAKHEAQLTPLLSANPQTSAFLSQAQALKFLGEERKKRKRKPAK
ncbi:DUF3102 domain-containing protein [Bradyrhizobium ganzhouense]|uniref:DUF3102 domain-containing protein n=1 Tax=Bradyrhizobium ganzhouense TaxID=1179767 RepID=UPI003CE91522